MDGVKSDWTDLEKELQKFHKDHLDYVKKLEESELLKKKYQEQFQKLNKRLKSLNKNVTSLEKNVANGSTTLESTDEIGQLKGQMTDNIDYMRSISDTFPKPNRLVIY